MSFPCVFRSVTLALSSVVTWGGVIFGERESILLMIPLMTEALCEVPVLYP